MQAFTVCQPFAELIASGAKGVENRTWPLRQTGWFAIHAGKSREWMKPGDELRHPGMPFGAVVAVVHIAWAVRIEELAAWARLNPAKWGWLIGHEHASGPWCWCIDRKSVMRLSRPIPCRGLQGIWKLPEYADRVCEEMIRARSDAAYSSDKYAEKLIFSGKTQLTGP